MAAGVSTSWGDFFLENDAKLKEINEKLESDEKIYEDLVPIYPPKDKIFRALDLCKFSDLKVIIIGQDCYHGLDKKTGKIQANGLCFSVDEGCEAPPSLKNIFRELKDDLGIDRKKTDLSDWASQGVLLLNAALTVLKARPESYLKLWEPLTDNLIKYISDNTENKIFVLWGNYAKKKITSINTEKHKIIMGNHPSPLSANRGGFFGEKYFSKINNYLREMGKSEIEW